MSANPIPDQRSIIESLSAGHSAANHGMRKELLLAAREATRRSYSPYSQFPVGAALATWSGKVYQGHNTETAGSEGLNCGERAAVLNAVTHGEHFLRRDFLQVVAVSCVKILSPYSVPRQSRNGPLIEQAVDLAVEEQDDESGQMNFAGLAPGWLSNKFVQASLSDGSPCGACRQVMNDFANEDTIILIDDLKDGVLFRMRDLLPVGFRFGEVASKPDDLVDDLELFEKLVVAGEFDLAVAADKVSYNSYSWGNSFLRNGTAIRCKDGRVYTGASMINSSTGLSINSPRAAINRAILDGAIERCGTQFVEEMQIAYPDHHGQGVLPRGFSDDLMLEFFTEDSSMAVSSTDSCAILKKTNFMNLFCS